MNSLEKANAIASKWSAYGLPYNAIRDAVIEMAIWQKEQIMRGFCYETKVYQDCDGDDIESPFQTWLSLEQNEITELPNIGLGDGDKVKVIIVKKEENNEPRHNTL